MNNSSRLRIFKTNWIFSIIGIIIAWSSQAANIIFDMDGVLVTRSPWAITWELKPWSFVGGFNPLHIQDLVMEFLERLIPYSPDIPHVIHNGRKLPAIMVLWLLGFITVGEIMELVNARLAIETKAMDSKRKAALIESIIKMIFTPERFAKTNKSLYKGVKLLKRCHRARNADGSRKNKIFILSNWDCASFKQLYQIEEFQEFLDLCDGVLVSGDIHRVKPDPRAYQEAFSAFDIHPEKDLTIFIDDEQANLDGALSLNHRMVRTILCKNKNLKPVKQKLKKMNLL